MESLSLSNLPHYTSGGSVHIVVNNQLGYTTPAQNARSSAYCSDIGKMINVPVVHVNGDFPEDVAHAMDLVFEYRNKFRKVCTECSVGRKKLMPAGYAQDIILDLMCYRRWGHNELDEPAFTQPVMYNTIRPRPSVARNYEEKLLDEQVLAAEEASAIRESQRQVLEESLQKQSSEGAQVPEDYHLAGNWQGIEHQATRPLPSDEPTTGVDTDLLAEIGRLSVTPPPSIQKLHPRLQKYHIDARLKRLENGVNLDWATAEALAFGSLLREGTSVRISGQDVGRGTFSQRHAMFVCQDTEKAVVPLNHMSEDQTSFLEVRHNARVHQPRLIRYVMYVGCQ